jgi:hypothetical protein
MDESTAWLAALAGGAAVTGSALAEVGKDVYLATKRILAEDVAGNVRAVLDRVRRKASTGHGIGPGALLYLTEQARYEDDDTLQDLWAELICAAIEGRETGGGLRWCSDQLKHFSRVDALVFAVAAAGYTYRSCIATGGRSAARSIGYLEERGLLTAIEAQISDSPGGLSWPLAVVQDLRPDAARGTPIPDPAQVPRAGRPGERLTAYTLTASGYRLAEAAKCAASAEIAIERLGLGVWRQTRLQRPMLT